MLIKLQENANVCGLQAAEHIQITNLVIEMDAIIIIVILNANAKELLGNQDYHNQIVKHHYLQDAQIHTMKLHKVGYGMETNVFYHQLEHIQPMKNAILLLVITSI